MAEVKTATDRRTYVGGSDAPAILGVSRFKNQLTVYAQKVEGVEVEQTEVMYWGNMLEDDVAEAYRERTGRDVIDPKGEVVLHPEHKWMGGKLDRRVVDKDLGEGALEIKTTGVYNKSDWDGEDPPLEPAIQLQHYLAVTGLDWGSVAVLIGGQEFRRWDVQRNDRFIESLIKREREFWQRVLDKRPPLPDGTMRSANAIRALYPEETEGAEVILNERAGVITGEIEMLKAEIARLELRKERFENEIRMVIADNEVGVLQDGRKWTLKTVKRDGFSVAPKSFRQLRAPTP